MLIKRLLHTGVIIIFCLLCWQGLIACTHIPDYFLPTPAQVLMIFIKQYPILFAAAKTTLTEALLGLFLALITGCLSALILFRFRSLYFLFWPWLLMSQAIPTLAIAPLLVLWLGYGLASKIVLVILMLFFPIASALLDGLRQVNPLYLHLAKLMTQNNSAILWHIQLPAALPHLASGIRIAAAGAMIGAIVGEWVGASQGLGFLLLESNARFATAQVFAIIIIIMSFSMLIYWTIHWLLNQLIKW